jgi:D-glycero-alpha-D-manno-heptose-7-phosphate kinase
MRLECSAPTRLDLAGGTIDIWPLYLFHGGAQTLNAAISLRAHALLEPIPGERVIIRSIDTGRSVEVDHWSELPARDELKLLACILYFFRARGVTLTTRSESPAGAGIAGSSALNIAVCAVMARWTEAEYAAETLLQIAMNIEAQAIEVPTGLQDYRPAYYGGIAAIELRPDGPCRVALEIDREALERRIVLAYTGEPRNSGTNNWEIYKRHLDGDRHVFDCFERIRDTAIAMRHALVRGDWTEVGRQLSAEWENRKRLAPGVTTPAIEALVARASTAGATAAKVCGAGGGGCLMCYAEPPDVPAVRNALIAGGARVLDYRIEPEGLRFG